MLKCKFSLRKEVQHFMETREKTIHEFQNPQCMCELDSLSKLLVISTSLIVIFKVNTNSFTPFTIPTNVFRWNWPYGNTNWKLITVLTFQLQLRQMEVGTHNSEKHSNCIRTSVVGFNDRFSDFKSGEILIQFFLLLSRWKLMPYQHTYKWHLPISEWLKVKRNFCVSSLTDHYLKYVSPPKVTKNTLFNVVSIWQKLSLWATVQLNKYCPSRN
jgi:hypothetical protein